MELTRPLIGVSTGFTDYGDYLGIAFTRPLELLGAAAVVVPYPRHPRPLVETLDGLLLGVGRDLEPHRFGARPHPSHTAHSPLRDEAELGLAHAAIGAGIPVLGICRGMQIINVALGGSLHADHSTSPAPEHPGGDWARWEQVVRAKLGDTRPPEHPSHEIEIEPDTRLHGCLGLRAIVNSYHHQSIATLGAGVHATAHAPDGVIEAIEVPGAGAFCVGVQWELQEQPGSPLFEAFVAAARARGRATTRRGAARPNPSP